MRRVALILGLIAWGIAGISAAPAAALEPAVVPADCASSPFDAGWVDELPRRWPHGRFTAAVIDLRSGCEYSYRPDLRITTASVFKAEVLAGVLLRAQAGGRDLSAREHDLVWPMITESANQPTSVLYGELGGAAGFEALNRRLGMPETQPAPSVWGLTRTSARDQAHLARQLLIGDIGPLIPRAVATAWRYMGSVVPSQTWGVGEGLSPGFRFGLKNGFAPSQCCGWRINTAGVVVDPRGGSWAMAVLTDGWGTEAAGRKAMSFVSSSINRTMTQRPLLDLVALNRQGQHGLELHALGSSDSYQSFRVQTRTALGMSGAADWSFALGDHDRDHRSDLFAIKHVGDSGGAEVHVLSGASTWKAWSLHAPTGLGPAAAEGWAFFAADYDRDHVDDLFAISKNGATGTEVHVLDGRSGFSRFAAHHATALHATSADWAFDLADLDRDGHQDLIGVNLAGSTGTEVHALSGASGFRGFLTHAPTALPAGRPGRWAFAASDRRGEGLPDLVAIARDGHTGTEVHVLDGATSWSTFSLHTRTALHATPGPEWVFPA